MATVTLWRHRREKAVYDLPRVCVKCGAASSSVRKRQFTWYPPWIAILLLGGILPFIIASMILTKRQWVETPLCDQHRNHWTFRVALVIAGFFGMILGWFLLCVTLTLLHDNQLVGDDWGILICPGGIAALVLWLIFVAVLNWTAIRPTNITDRSITLTNVSPEFARVLQEEADAYERDLDRDVSDRWRESSRRAQRSDEERIEPGDRPPPNRSTDITEEEPDEPT